MKETALRKRPYRVVTALLVVALWSCSSETTSPATSDQDTSDQATSEVVATPPPPEAPVSTSLADITTQETIISSTTSPRTTTRPEAGESAVPLVSSEGKAFPPPPPFPDGPTSDELLSDLDAFFDYLESEQTVGHEELVAMASHRDVRISWILTDMLRFVGIPDVIEIIGARLQGLLGDEALDGAAPDLWKSATDLLIAWDVPALPEYWEYKKRLFVLVEPRWEPFFADSSATIDWRWLSWGGVLIDDRPLGDTGACPRGCIPSLDDPSVTSAAGGDWYPDDRVVFGITINGESRAYPKHQMEVHEMVNDTLGGRRIGMPYCTLCGSAQAYFTDQVPNGVETPVLRTSGLLSRSNKVMFDLLTWSVFDTFTGEAVSGPLREAGVRLAQATVVASTWAAWKEAHPDTTIVAQDGGLGRPYSLDPLQGRDDFGPIFPVGDVDTRLGVQELVVGVELKDGTTIAFPRQAALSAIDSGEKVTAGGVRLIKDGDGLRAVAVSDGSEIPAHQAFWFAWSQFWPDTLLWSPSPR